MGATLLAPYALHSTHPDSYELSAVDTTIRLLLTPSSGPGGATGAPDAPRPTPTPIERQWRTMRDAAVCAWCYMNESMGLWLDFWLSPGDVYPSGDAHPPAHHGCRCWEVYRL